MSTIVRRRCPPSAYVHICKWRRCRPSVLSFTASNYTRRHLGSSFGSPDFSARGFPGLSVAIICSARGIAQAHNSAMGSALKDPEDYDIYEESGELPAWSQIFDPWSAWLDVHDTSSGVCRVAEIENRWGFKVVHAFDDHESFDDRFADHYIELRLGDWICPRADFWKQDGADRWYIGGEDEWTFASTCNPLTMVLEHGWVPTEWCNHSLVNQEPGTYVSLQLGGSRVPLPVATLECHVDEHPKVHCTIGYLPRLSPEATELAIKNGNRLIHKFIRDGVLPEYTHRPHVVCSADGKESLAGICTYSSRHIGAHGNSYSLMRNAKVRVRDPIEEFVADFDHIHIKRGVGPFDVSGLSIVGSLHSMCYVHELAMRLRGFLQNEVVGQWNEPMFDLTHHHWSKPHLTLSKVVQA